MVRWSHNGELDQPHDLRNPHMFIMDVITGWWLSHPSENMSSSVGMMKFPTAWKKMFQTTNQNILIILNDNYINSKSPLPSLSSNPSQMTKPFAAKLRKREPPGDSNTGIATGTGTPNPGGSVCAWLPWLRPWVFASALNSRGIPVQFCWHI